MSFECTQNKKIPFPIETAEKKITTDLPAFVMGVLNITDNSFFSGSTAFTDVSFAVEKALQMAEEGADFIDIGGEATNPGQNYIDAKTELGRVIPVIEGIRKHSDVPLSIDTRKMEVFSAAVDAGADILNDISALEDDKYMASFAAETGCAVILMHKRGEPKTMQLNTKYNNVEEEVAQYLASRCIYAQQYGMESSRLILDAGIGFGKSFEDNKKLITASEKISVCDGAKHHVVMALSRKRCIGDITGRSVDQRLIGTVTANLIAVKYGADILRVHDVAETVDMLKIYRELA
jgi:dihydropteroate synthase